MSKIGDGSHRELTTWNPMFGARTTRLSMSDDRGGEYFMIIERPSSGWRDIKERALKSIEAAIEAGDQPGCVND